MKSAPSFGVLVGRVVRLHREIRGMDLRAMAEHMGVGVSGWSRVETGVVTMNVVQLAMAAEKLGVPPSKIISDAEQIVQGMEKRSK